MHSKIFQITTENVSKDLWLNEDTLYQGETSDIDYCAEIDDELRRKSIYELSYILLSTEMFELTSDNTLLYKGGAEKWKNMFAESIHNKASEVTSENVSDWIGPLYRLEKFLKNALDVSFKFYTDEQLETQYACESTDFMFWVCKLEPNITLYIGGIIDYHY